MPQQKSFDALAAYLNGSTVNVTVNGHPQRYTGRLRDRGVPADPRRVAADGARLHRRRQHTGAGKVAIIGYGIWQRDFGGAADIVGKGVRINGKPATVIGVMPKGSRSRRTKRSGSRSTASSRRSRATIRRPVNPAVLGLLKAGVSLDQANAEATTIAQRFAAAYPETNKQFNTGQVQPLLDTFTPRPLRGTMWTMLGFCVGVLLISCVNVMNMQFARATLRAKELAVRSSLGASRCGSSRQMLTESLLVAGIGASLGIVLAYASIDWLSATVRNLENPPPSWITFDIDGRCSSSRCSRRWPRRSSPACCRR